MLGPEDNGKDPLGQEETPGVRGPARPAPTEGGADQVEPAIWGDEGGAGAYQGAPVISEDEDEDEDASRGAP